MKKQQLLITVCALTVLLSIFMVYRSFSARSVFDLAVNESLRTSEGYDQRFIDMVNRLEELLATRAQFGYSGGKDPMTGVTRHVVQAAPTPPPRPRHQAQQQVASGGTETAPPPAAEPPADQVRLTAIIADATGSKISAVIMDGERSYSVDVGDKVSGRKITRITNEGIYMESETMLYFYDIYGNVVRKSKESSAVSSPAPLREQPKEEPKVEPPQKKAPPVRSRPQPLPPRRRK